MSLTLNMVGGGGGGLKATDALLRVQAPAGSTVTITKGTTTKTDLGHENADDNSVYDYYFIIHASQFDSVNPWTVTATLGTQTASSTIVINAADEYDVNLAYRIDLYINGDQCVSVTGGWSKAQTQGTLTLGTTEMDFKSGSDGTERYVATENAIDLTTFSTVYFSAKCNSSSAKNVGVKSARDGAWVASQAITRGTEYTVYAVDVSSLTGAYYVVFSNASSPTATFVNLVYAE